MKRHKISDAAGVEEFGRDLLAALGRPFFGDELFDHVTDTVFFMKDAAARYVAVNTTLVQRCGLTSKAAIIGCTARDVFPAPLGERFDDQDRRVLRDGLTLDGQLELHLYPGGQQGWCLTWKQPLYAKSGSIAGLSGISRDIAPGTGIWPDVAGLSHALDHIRDNLDTALRLPDLAALAGMSVFQFDQRIRTLFGLSAGQYLTRARIELACNRLRRSDDTISAIAQQCGYSDQAAFTRQFSKSVGMTPKAFRTATAAL